jgi:hypothetical protein
MDVCPSSGFSLLALPTDLLTTVLQQASIGARELCCLEACASALKNAIDESIWRTVFLHQRRPNALREPENWKQEFARRDSWSSGWRQLIASANMPIPNTRLGGHTQKLRRFALKIMSSVPISPSPKYMTHIVDPRGLQPGSHLTINDALSRAKPYDVVMLEPGTYHERLRIERPVEVVGRGPHGSCTIIGTDGPTIEVRIIRTEMLIALSLFRASRPRTYAMTLTPALVASPFVTAGVQPDCVPHCARVHRAESTERRQRHVGRCAGQGRRVDDCGGVLRLL